MWATIAAAVEGGWGSTLRLVFVLSVFVGVPVLVALLEEPPAGWIRLLVELVATR